MMNMKNNTSKPQICRLCLAQTTICFSLTEDGETSEMLEALTSLRILATDEISTIMCLKCSLNLKLAFKIQQNMLKAEQRFREQRFFVPIKLECDVVEDSVINYSNEMTQDDKGIGVNMLSSEETKTFLPKLDKLETHTCDVCGAVKFSKEKLRKHKFNVHVNNKCPLCGKKITQTNMKRHIERHQGGDAICELCGVKMKSQDLRVHMYYKHTNRSFKCGFCDRVFRKKCNKIVHEKKEHLGEEADFMCDTCGKKFYQKRDLKRHVESTHLKLRPHICEFCKVGFSSKHALRTHRRQHTNETPYRCDICGDGFRQKVSLKGHLKSKHKIEEDLICECKICKKKFASKSALAAHCRVH